MLLKRDCPRPKSAEYFGGKNKRGFLIPFYFLAKWCDDYGFCNLVALITCFKRTRVVTVPTPPGTGVMAPASSLAASVSTVEFVVFNIDTDIHDNSAGFDVILGDHFGFTDSCYQDIGSAANPG
jgi:hypothetical protein